jgi:L-asparagine oxygenase
MISIRSQLENVGYAFLSAFRPSVSTNEIVTSLGIALTLGASSTVHQLMPKSKARSTPNTYSGIFGRDQLPLHTDLAHWRFPPRVLMLRCVKGFEAVPTLLLDGAKIIDDTNRGIFSRTLVRPRRPVEGSLPLLRLYDRQQGDQGLLRWDEVFICPASPAGEIGVRKFTECLIQSTLVKVSLAKSGDTLVIDNWRMLHGRSTVPADCQGRVVERAYLEKLH